MGKALAQAYPAARAVFDEADEALGDELSRLCFEGPEEELKLTANTQPAILTVSRGGAPRCCRSEAGGSRARVRPRATRWASTPRWSPPAR